LLHQPSKRRKPEPNDLGIITVIGPGKAFGNQARHQGFTGSGRRFQQYAAVIGANRPLAVTIINLL